MVTRIMILALLAPGLLAAAIDPQAWEQFKATHSLILFLDQPELKVRRCVKARLADLEESPRARVEEDEEHVDFNWVGGAGSPGRCRLLPKGTELISLIPKGTGARCDVYSEVDEEGSNYMVVLMPDPFKGKFFEIRSASCFKCLAAIVVPHEA